MDLSAHYFDPFFEGNGPCWCGRGKDHRLHVDLRDRSQRHYPKTPEGKVMRRAQELRTTEANKAFWSLQRRNNLLSLIPFLGRRTHG